jgi:hypothetical protein
MNEDPYLYRIDFHNYRIKEIPIGAHWNGVGAPENRIHMLLICEFFFYVSFQSLQCGICSSEENYRLRSL